MALDFSVYNKRQLLALNDGQHIRFSGEFPWGIEEEFKNRLEKCSII